MSAVTLRALALLLLLSICACDPAGAKKPKKPKAALPSLDATSFDAEVAVHPSWLLGVSSAGCGGGAAEAAAALAGGSSNLARHGVRVALVDVAAAPALGARLGAAPDACGELLMVSGGRVYAGGGGGGGLGDVVAYALGGFLSEPSAPLPALGEALRAPVAGAPFDGACGGGDAVRGEPPALDGGGAPALVFLYATWSPASAVAVPIFRAAVEALCGRGVALHGVDVGDGGGELPSRLRARRVPALVLVVRDTVCFYNSAWSPEAIVAFAVGGGAGAVVCEPLAPSGDAPPALPVEAAVVVAPPPSEAAPAPNMTAPPPSGPTAAAAAAAAASAAPASAFIVLGDAGARDFVHGVAPASLVVFASRHCAAPGGLQSRYWHTVADVLWPLAAVYLVDSDDAVGAVLRFNVDMLPAVVLVKEDGTVFLFSETCARGGPDPAGGIQSVVQFVQRDHESCPWEKLPPPGERLTISHAAPRGVGRSHVVVLGDANFTRFCGISRELLLLFCSDGVRACTSARAAADTVSHERFPALSVAYVGAEAAPRLRAAYNVSEVPHGVLLRDGAPAATLAGVALTLDAIARFLDELGVHDRMRPGAAVAVTVTAGGGAARDDDDDTSVSGGDGGDADDDADLVSRLTDTALIEPGGPRGGGGGGGGGGLSLLAFEAADDGACAGGGCSSGDLRALARAYRGLVRVARVACGGDPAVRAAWGVHECPGVAVLRDGQLLQSRSGPWTLELLRDMVETHK